VGWVYENSKTEDSERAAAWGDRSEVGDCLSPECLRFFLSLILSWESFRLRSVSSGDMGGRSLSLMILGGRPNAGLVGSGC
jgi:hypothetical protein